MIDFDNHGMEKNLVQITRFQVTPLLRVIIMIWSKNSMSDTKNNKIAINFFFCMIGHPKNFIL